MAASNLSARAIARHFYNPHGSGRQVLWDRNVTGLGVRALASGRRVYVLSYRYQGRSRFMHLGRVADFRDVAEAREVAAKHLRRLRREQLDPLAERRRERAAGTLSQLFEQWLAQVARRRSPRTLADYRRCVDRYLVRAIGALRPAAYLSLLLLTGARSGELLKLRWAEVSFERAQLRLLATKNHEDFLRKLSAPALDVLRALPRVGSGQVFPARRRDGGACMTRPRAAWRGVLKRAGIARNVTFHDLRRTVGVLLSSRGFTAEQIARQLNHKSNITAKVYVRVADDLQQRMADVLGSAGTELRG